MWIVAIAWMYVALMMAVTEAFSPQGSLLGAFFTLLLYGVGPVALVMYLLATPARRRARRRAEAAQDARAAEAAPPQPPSGLEPDAGSLSPGDPVAPERKEP